MKYLILVESPAKCNKILSFLNRDYSCEATYGHLRQLKSLDNIDNMYEASFENMKEKQKQIDKIGKKIKKCDEVILATDDDREGEGIAWHIIKIFNLPLETKRIKFNSITKDSIVSAIQNPMLIDMNVVASQQTRQILDLLVGFKISPILWKEISRTSNLSAGRCQTPALHILYENYMKIKTSQQELSYKLHGYFSNKNIKFNLNTSFINENDITEFLTICKNISSFIVKHECTMNIEKKPPLPFITSSLQQASSNQLNISPKECMSICQKLYESGYITYMRTDSYHIADKFKCECKEYIASTYGDRFYNPTILNENKKNSQDAHEAIRPTDLSLPDLKGKEKKMYDLIRSQTLKSLMTSAYINKHKFMALVDDRYHFDNNIDEIIFNGWMILEKESNETQYLQYLLNVNKITCNRIESDSSYKNTTLYYSEAKLIQELERKQIGRPSTFAGIVEKLKERKYVIKGNIEGKKVNSFSYQLYDHKIHKMKIEKTIGTEKNKLIIQPLGILVIEVLMKHFHELFEYNFTENMEHELDLIAQNIGSKFDSCNKLNELISTLIGVYHDKHSTKLMIDDTHEFIISKNGPVIKANENGLIVFKKIIKNFDLEKIKNKEYSIEELLDNTLNERILGKYKGNDIIIRNGKYGNYIEHDGKKISIKSLDKSFDDITLVDVIDMLDSTVQNDMGIIHEITNEISIRNGKFGHYIYYKTNQMKKPKFINLKKFHLDYSTCDKCHIIEFVENNT
jgi:DNA topoisomerase-1